MEQVSSTLVPASPYTSTKPSSEGSGTTQKRRFCFLSWKPADFNNLTLWVKNQLRLTLNFFVK
jgi:hypothetical protein